MLRTLVAILALLQLGYLVIANLALNLSLTQSLVNQFRPDKYEVSWERAWSWYPFRVHARGVAANGQTATQQWQASAPAASASVSLLPLLQRTVRLDGLDVVDLDLRVRPRPRADRDDAATRPFFPPIANRDPEADAVPPPPRDPDRAWHIQVRNARAHGQHDLWVRHVRGTLEGEVVGDLEYETRRGPLSVANGAADVVLRSLTIGGDETVVQQGTIAGTFALAPFVPSRNRGWRSLAFLAADATADLSVASLAFLDLYLDRIGGMRVDGAGHLAGRVHYDFGALAAGTDVGIRAQTLSVRALGHEATGGGDIRIAVETVSRELLAVDIRFDRLEARQRGAATSLFTGTGLRVDVAGDTRILPDGEAGIAQLTVEIPDVDVPDLHVYQRYLPARWGLSLDGGDGALSGRLAYSPGELAGRLTLGSRAVETDIRGHRFRGNLDLDLRVDGETAAGLSIDLAGSDLRLHDMRVRDADGGTGRPWGLSLSLDRGRLDVPMDHDLSGQADFGALVGAIQKDGLAAWLSSADAELDAILDVSDLRWLETLFPNPYGLTIAGASEATLELRLTDGDIAQGSRLHIVPSDLAVGMLDYVAEGNGEAMLTVEQGGRTPALRLDATLDDARLRRSLETESMIEQVALSLSAHASDVISDGRDAVESMHLRIPSARVTDMRVYNQYLPAGAPLSLQGGQADLVADVRLDRGSASGFVTLESEGLQARLDEQDVAGRLRLDVRIRDGDATEMVFDIAGSRLLLDRFRVSGRQETFDRADWGAGLDFETARVRWRKPVGLDLEANIEMTDSRPIVAMFANQRGEHPFLQKILTVEDIRGDARLHVADNEVLVPHAMAGGDKIDVGLKGLVRGDDREGIFFARFRKLHGIVKLRNGERNIDVVRARRTFDAYVPGETPLKIRGVGASETSGVTPDGESENASGGAARGGQRQQGSAYPFGTLDGL